MNTLENIVNSFPITNAEYEILDKKFGKLAHYAAWELKRKNVKNANVNDPDDDVQELRIALVRAGSYYKRQTYIESCFDTLDKQNIKDKFIVKVFKELKQLWADRRRHGANRQKFGVHQQIILDQLIKKYVPCEERPKRDQLLNLDLKFTTYCKQIIWNAQKSLGKKITKEKSWRTGLVSLSDFDYLGVAV
jgi:hypothetical protein